MRKEYEYMKDFSISLNLIKLCKYMDNLKNIFRKSETLLI